MIMSHCGISVIIHVRLYDRQDELKTGVRKETYPYIYIINPYTLWLRAARGTEMLAIMKNIWTPAISAYLWRIVYAALHIKTAAQLVLR